MYSQKADNQVLPLGSHIGYCDIVQAGDDIKLEFVAHGFRPDAVIEKSLGESLYRLLDLTPQETSLRSRIELCEDGFEMFVLLTFTDCSIFATHSGATVAEAIEQTLDQLYLRVRKWKTDKAIDHRAGGGIERMSGKFREVAAKSRPNWKFTPRILIVDDNRMSVKLIESCLRQQGCETNIVTRGSDAVSEITRNDYDLMVLDWQMPELNGADTLICAQDIISYDSTFRHRWASSQMSVITYSGEDRMRIIFPECDNFKLRAHIPKSSTFSQLKQATFEILHSLRPE